MAILKEVFFYELGCLYSSEIAITRNLPILIKSASSLQLKEALLTHLKETKNHVARLEEISLILNIPPNNAECDAMIGILQEAINLIQDIGFKSAITDVAILLSAQKIEHYEIAVYEFMHGLGEQLKLDKVVLNLLQDTLNEENNASKKLNYLAEGSFFTSGINKDAIKEEMRTSEKTKRNVSSKKKRALSYR